MKSGSLNLLEPSGPVQQRTGIAVPLLYMKNIKIRMANSVQTNSLPSLLQDIWLTKSTSFVAYRGKTTKAGRAVSQELNSSIV